MTSPCSMSRALPSPWVRRRTPLRRKAQRLTRSNADDGFAAAVDDLVALSRMTLPVLVVMGVSGSGKSTVAKPVAERLGWPFQEGDDLHPAANVVKMKAGIPLDDSRPGAVAHRHRRLDRRKD